MAADHYETLGVPVEASHAEVRAAYLRVMRAHHPDRRPHDAGSAERALRANAAWEVLGSRARRASYDRLRAGRGSVVAGPRGVSAPTGRPRPRPAAYSAQGDHYRKAFHRACVKTGAVVFATGLVLLLAVA